jgi:glycosyltransferase involved in cell wall biosynthesis
MKKVLIISYYFPPSGFVGGERTYSWYKYLNENAYYPIVITRQWDDNQKDETKIAVNNSLSIEKNSIGEIHKLAYKPNLRDKLSAKNGFFSKLLRKFLTFLELITIKFSLILCPYKNMYFYASEILNENPDCELLIISGKPFNSFRFGYLLKKQHKNLKWIADYRDEWTTMSNEFAPFTLEKLIWKLDRSFEKKWLSTASFFTTTSQRIINRISDLTQKKGFLVLNGFDVENPVYEDKTDKNTLRLLYSGTLYRIQRIELMINLIKKINNNLKDFKIELYFIGIDVILIEKERVLKAIGNDNNFIVIDRIPKSELISFYEKTDCFFLTSYEQHIGWLPVKIFDYVAWKKNIILFPSDNDVMEEFIFKTQSGFSVSVTDECENILRTLIKQKKNQGIIKIKHKLEEISKFSRRNQTKLLSQSLNLLN